MLIGGRNSADMYTSLAIPTINEEMERPKKKHKKGFTSTKM